MGLLTLGARGVNVSEVKVQDTVKSETKMQENESDLDTPGTREDKFGGDTPPSLGSPEDGAIVLNDVGIGQGPKAPSKPEAGKPAFKAGHRRTKSKRRSFARSSKKL